MSLAITLLSLYAVAVTAAAVFLSFKAFAVKKTIRSLEDTVANLYGQLRKSKGSSNG